MNKNLNILMAAAENDALPGGKVGGIGDVVRDIPVALAKLGHRINVVTPGYQYFSRLPDAEFVARVEVDFGGRQETVEVFQVPAKIPCDGVTHWALEHPLFAAAGNGRIYCDDPPDRPFATDARKFALFCAAVAKGAAINTFGGIDILHLHDWHAALVAVLRKFDPAYRALADIPTVYTIHNLALQGVRPLEGDVSSLANWYPGLEYDREQINDPRVPHCINPMRAGINLSDKVHAVSPHYASEILKPSDPAQGYFGGEGLEADLQRAAREDRLEGILNGCEYNGDDPPPLPREQLIDLCEAELLKWIGNNPQVDSAHLIALHRLDAWRAAGDGKEQVTITSVGRITDQKVRLLQAAQEDGKPALEGLLDILDDKGVLIMLGSGDTELENFLTRVAAARHEFIFLKGYSEALSRNLYSSGDLFLMPSSFEPCGISQMLAMRAGQPCLVHSVGGLADTVHDGENGFSFNGDSLQDQVAGMLTRFKSVLKIRRKKPGEWQRIATAAAASRFLWEDAARDYVTRLYGKDRP